MIYKYFEHAINVIVSVTFLYGYLVIQTYLLCGLFLPFILPCTAIYLLLLAGELDAVKRGRVTRADLKAKRFCRKDLVVDTIIPDKNFDPGNKIQYFHYVLKDTDGQEFYFISPRDITTFKEEEYAGAHISITYLQESRMISHIDDCAPLEKPDYKVWTGRMYKGVEEYMVEEEHK